MAMVTPRIHRSRSVYFEIFVVACLIILAALALTIIFNGPAVANPYTFTVDPGAGLYP